MSATAVTNGAAAPAVQPTIVIQRLAMASMLVPIIGSSPLLMHRFSEKARRQMLDAMQGKKSPKQPKDPDAEFQAALYLGDDGQPGMPSTAFKSAMVEASRFFDKSVTKVLLRQAVFVHGVFSAAAGLQLVPIESDAPVMREDVVRVGIAGTDLRYRPEFREWRAVLPISYVSSLLSRDSVLSLVEAAGFGVGVGEWRPERSGDFGQFKIDSDREVSELAVTL